MCTACILVPTGEDMEDDKEDYGIHVGGEGNSTLLRHQARKCLVYIYRDVLFGCRCFWTYGRRLFAADTTTSLPLGMGRVQTEILHVVTLVSLQDVSRPDTH